MTDYALEDTVFVPFTTRAFATGIPTVLSGTPAVDIYEDATATPIVTGDTLSVDHNSVVGFNMVTITATSGTGFNLGGKYTVVIQAGTVGGVSVVGEVVGEFTIGHSASFARLGAPAGASVSADIAVIEGQTDDIGVAGAGLTAINLPNQTMDIVGNITGNLSGSVGSVTAQVTANTTAISGDTTAADNLEAMYDGTGYIDDTAPASRSQVDNISVIGGGAVNFNPDGDNVSVAIKGISFVGVQTSGTFTDTFTLNSVFHVIDDTGNAIDVVYSVDITSQNEGSTVIISAFLSSNNDTMNILAYDFVGAGWEQIETLTGQNGTDNKTIEAPLLSRHTGVTGADEGMVLIRIQNTGQSNPTLNVDRIIVQAVTNVTTLGFLEAAVWVDTANGTSGTGEGVGHATNPSDNLTDAYTIATANNLKRFKIEPGSTVTLPASSTDKEFSGRSYNVLLNSADIDNSSFEGGSFSGIATAGSGNAPNFTLCGIGTVTLPPSNGFQCGFFGTFTLGSAGSYTWGGSAEVFDLPVIIDFGSGLNASGFFLQSWGGGEIEIQNAGAGTGTYKLDLNGTGHLTLNANCSATFEVDLHGSIGLTNNASGITITRDNNYALTDITARFDGVEGATFSTGTDSLEAIRNRGDAAWTTGGSGSDPAVLQNTTIATLASQVSFTLTAGSADDDAYNGMLAVIEDQSTATQKAIGVISDYTGSSKTITLREDPGIFTMATGDTIDIVLSQPDTLDIVADTNELQTDWANGGRLDLIVDATLADTANMQPKLGTPAADISADIAAVKVDTAATLVDTADMQPKLGTPAADVSADIAAVKVDTAATLVDTGTTLPARFDTVDTSLADIPTVAEFEVRTPTAAQLAYITANAATAVPVTFTTSGGSTTVAVLALVDGSAGSATDDQYNGRLLVFTDGTLDGVVTDITDYTGSTTTATITAIPFAPTATHNARLI